VDPHHILFLFYLNKILYKLPIDIAVVVPELGVRWVDVGGMRSFEAVEEGPKELLMEKQELFDFLLTEPNWIALLCLQQDCYLLLIFLSIWDDARPANPLEVDNSLFSELENRGIKHALALFDLEAAGFLLYDSHGKFVAQEHQRVILVNLNLGIKQFLFNLIFSRAVEVVRLASLRKAHGVRRAPQRLQAEGIGQPIKLLYLILLPKEMLIVVLRFFEL